jgi:hypothetical protein
LSRDRLWAIFLILIAAYLYYYTYGFIPEAAKYPRILLVMMVFLSLIMLFNSSKAKTGESSDENPWRAIITFLISLGYYGLIFLFSFLPATLIFLPVLMYVMGARDWKIILVTTVAVEVFIYFIFVLQLKVVMPSGLVM